MRLSLKIVALVLSVCAIYFLFCGVALAVHAQSDLQTTKYRNMVMDLGNGLKTNAQLTIPAVGGGPFPGVLLIQGSGAVDMDETLGFIRIDNKTGSKIYPTAQPFFQIAEYLSERGFAVLRYDKRGVGTNFTILDSNVWGNVTFDDLKQDAETALSVLLEQPEVNATKKATLIGHSEGTTIAPRVAVDNRDKVKNIVLMGSIAQNPVNDLLYYQEVVTPSLYAERVLDKGHLGQLSMKEAAEDPNFLPLVRGNLTQLLFTQADVTDTQNETTQQLQPKYNETNDDFVSIDDELKPALLIAHENRTFPQTSMFSAKCLNLDQCPMWLRSHSALDTTLSMIGNVSSNASILILQGENDSQTPLEQGLLLQQRLTEVDHPDHTLITYPDLGHTFYPSSQWLTALGPMEEYVLQDMFEWLTSPARDVNEEIR